MKKLNHRDHEYMGAGSQILRLCLKDISVNRGMFLLACGTYFCFSSLCFGIQNEFDVFFVIFPIFMLDGLMRNEDRYNVEGLFCSLPVKRAAVVFARYVTSLLILIVFIVLSYLSILLIRAVLPPSSYKTAQVGNVKLLFVALFIYTMFVSVSVYNYSRFGHMGFLKGRIFNGILTIVACAIPWGVLYVISSLYSGSWELVQYAGPSELYNRFVIGVAAKTIYVFGKSFIFIALSVFMGAFIAVSLMLSIKYYKKRDF